MAVLVEDGCCTQMASFVLDALERSFCAALPASGFVHNSDRGSRHVSIRYTERLADAGIELSAGSGGDSHHNAFAKTINRLYKANVIHRRGPWKSFEIVEFAILEWIDCFSH